MYGLFRPGTWRKSGAIARYKGAVWNIRTVSTPSVAPPRPPGVVHFSAQPEPLFSTKTTQTTGARDASRKRCSTRQAEKWTSISPWTDNTQCD